MIDADLTPLTCAVLAGLVCLALGLVVGFRMGVEGVVGCIRGGKFSRVEMADFLRQWRGPDGERW